MSSHLKGKQEEIVAELVHQNPGAVLYWYIDRDYIGSTTSRHKMPISPKPGKHIISVTDNFGNTIKCSIVLIE